MSIFEWQWGYCKHCVRLEPVGDDGLMLRHTIARHRDCEGSEHAPFRQPGPEAPDGGDYRTLGD